MILSNLTAFDQYWFALTNIYCGDKSFFRICCNYLSVYVLILCRNIFVFFHNLPTYLLIRITKLRKFYHLSFMKTILIKPLYKNFVKSCPFLANLLFWCRSTNSPNIFIVIFTLNNAFYSHTIWVYFWPSYFSIFIKHKTSVKNL